MAISVREVTKSRSRTVEERSASASLEFFVTGSLDDDDVYAAVLASTPRMYGTLRRRRVSLDPLGGGCWNSVVEYGRDLGEPQSVTGTPPSEPSPSDPLGAEFSFDTTGGTQHITQSIRTRHMVRRGGATMRQFFDGIVINGFTTLTSFEAEANFAAADVGSTVSGDGIPASTTIASITDAQTAVMSQAATADAGPGRILLTRGVGIPPSYNRAIGVSKDGVAGCDVPAPKLEFSITRNFSFVTLAWIKTVKELSGKVNNKDFFSFATGELMFLGATGAPGPDKLVRVTFKFAAGRNERNIDLADDGELRIPDKYGWDHIWVAYEDAAESGNLISRPKAAYCEQVVEFGDFRILGI